MTIFAGVSPVDLFMSKLLLMYTLVSINTGRRDRLYV